MSDAANEDDEDQLTRVIVEWSKVVAALAVCPHCGASDAFTNPTHLQELREGSGLITQCTCGGRFVTIDERSSLNTTAALKEGLN
jgi:hypothetical protein